MDYISTRGRAPRLPFDEVLLAGLAEDGGLYLPTSWPRLEGDDLRALRGASYGEVAQRVLAPFVGGSMDARILRRHIDDAYGRFATPAVAPLRQLDADLWLMELFHGPTLAFKDVAMQLIVRLFAEVLERRGQRVTIVTATSGDTGAAAVEACANQPAIDLVVLHPLNRVSPVQRRQMTTVDAPNIHNVAVEGTFDDCQDLVKAMFADAGFRKQMRLSAVNSINWARVIAQTVYYVWAGVQLGAPDRTLSFSVPTGNFGNVYAAFAAAQMGMPIERLMVASNKNDILTRFLQSDDMRLETVVATLSPSMDIQVSSNVERLIFDLMDRDGAATETAMRELRERRELRFGRKRHGRLRPLFTSLSLDDEGTLEVIRQEWEGRGQLIDPHTAIGLAGGKRLREEVQGPVVVAATAHPAKFPDAVEQATGQRPALPPRLADLFERPEKVTTLPANLERLQSFIRDNVAAAEAANS